MKRPFKSVHPILKIGAGTLLLATIVVYAVLIARADSREVETTVQPVASSRPVFVSAPARAILVESLSTGLNTIGTWRGKPALADLNSDGKLDLVASVRRWDHAHAGDGLHVWMGDGKGNWTDANAGIPRNLGYGGASIADINNDGLLDIAFSCHEGSPRVFLGDGHGNWMDYSNGIESHGVSADVVVGDLEGNGTTALVVLGQFPGQGGLTIFSLTKAGVWGKNRELLPREDFGARVLLRDFDADGSLEVFAATSVGPRVWKRVDGNYKDISEGLPTPLVGGMDLGVDLADLDGTGLSLLVCGMLYEGHQPLSAYRYSMGTWKQYDVGFTNDEAVFDLKCARVNDGKSTQIIAAGKSGISVYSMSAPGRYERKERVDNTDGVFNVGAGDVDGNGRDEVVFVGERGVKVLSLTPTQEEK